VRDLLLSYARKSDCDYAIFLDSDVFALDKDFIMRITKHDGDLVGGAYMRQFGAGLGVAAYFKGQKEKYRIVRAIRPELHDAVAVGGGCMCISRWLLLDENVRFYPLLFGDTAEDFGYCLKAGERCWKVQIDGSLDMLHLDTTNRQKPWTVSVDGEYLEWSY
jgi:hypothetical protein